MMRNGCLFKVDKNCLVSFIFKSKNKLERSYGGGFFGFGKKLLGVFYLKSKIDWKGLMGMVFLGLVKHCLVYFISSQK